ncbi:MAG: DUF1425 domain-containing protein [wastewater metagenome]|nr:DUF1425 domain-containing protein [Candidatus Loosdrechtia aerotolerans]
MKKKTNSSRVLTCLIAGIALFSSCTTVNTVERATPVGTRHIIADKRIITDSGLHRKVSIVGLNEGTTHGGFLQIQVEVLNQKNSMQAFSYSIEWFDLNGMLIHTPTSVWIPRQIEGGETLAITAVAPTTTAKDFRVKFIEDVRK